MQAQLPHHFSGLASTDLSQAFSSLNLQEPDENWYMDSNATSHLTRSAGFSYGDTSYEMQ
ncbi:hypothetical protein RND71_034409 [Anisodus tanguticus]|uniref:Uncharacterized protein n=1 Tax=Anisodus tanguticus TaxID=243964 RepID=A0AAE1V4Z8_9SOLA|nr:hypothetical protein RND71_034409 [Anisodus tanguticus]